MQYPAMIEDMSFEEYLADPAPEPSLSSSLVKDLGSLAPRRIWEESERLNPEPDATDSKDTFNIGTAAHRLLTRSGNPMAVIDATDWRTKAAKEQKDAAIEAGQTPILKHQYDQVLLMASAAREQFLDNQEAGPLLKDALREVTFIWQEGGCWHRCRPDFYHPGANAIIHYKTTSVNLSPHTVGRYAADMGWAHTAAHYEAGITAYAGKPPKQYFAIQETAKPHLAMVVELDGVFTGLGHMRRDRAIAIWTRCLRDNIWPGLPQETIKIECPEWYERRVTDEKDRELELTRPGEDLLDRMRAWQAPVDWRREGGK